VLTWQVLRWFLLMWCHIIDICCHSVQIFTHNTLNIYSPRRKVHCLLLPPASGAVEGQQSDPTNHGALDSGRERGGGGGQGGSGKRCHAQIGARVASASSDPHDHQSTTTLLYPPPTREAVAAALVLHPPARARRPSASG
jgi:hypothetical protein